MVTFDTLGYARRLRGAGLTDEQAEVHAEALATALGEVLVTKLDLRDLATRDDVHRLEIAAKQEFADVRQEMRGEFAAVRQEMRGEFAAVRQEMRGEFAAVRQEMRGEFAAVRQEMSGGFADVRQEMVSGFADARQEMTSGFAGVQDQMRGLELRMTIRMGALFSVGIGALVALIKLT